MSQILLAFRDVLKDKKIDKNAEWFKSVKETDICPYYGEKVKQNQVEALCQKWLDGLNPLIDREHKTVLTELIQILENI
jgi:hypothetical protein